MKQAALWLGVIAALAASWLLAAYIVGMIDQSARSETAVLDLSGPPSEIVRADRCVTDAGEACVVCQVPEGEWIELGDVCHTDPAARVWHDAKRIDPRGSVWQ